MSSIDTGPESKATKIADSTDQCLRALEQCLLLATSVHAREFSKLEDQVARLHTWSMSLGIFAPGRASADHRLRHTPEVYTVIIGLLDALQYRIRTCMAYTLKTLAMKHGLVFIPSLRFRMTAEHHSRFIYTRGHLHIHISGEYRNFGSSSRPDTPWHRD